ncbi:zinc-binding alcohol dehydrogenase family protein [Streptomyces sp. E-15]
MRAIRYERFGGYDVLELVDVAVPQASEDAVVVRMTVAGVNPLDETVRSGKLAPHLHKPLPIRPGGFGVGVIEDAGGTSWEVGTRVAISGGRYGVSTDGTWADYAAVHPRHLVRVPDAVTDEGAAALTTGTGYLTAYLALTRLAGFEAGRTVLAPGIGGAVGQGGVEVARVLGAARAISTATDTARAEHGRAAGYDVIDLSQESLSEGVARLTDGAGVDVVLDGVGGPVTGQALKALATDGSLISIGYAGGRQATVDVTDLIWKNAHVHGFRFALFTDDDVNSGNDFLLGLLAQGKVRPSVARTFPLEEAAAAQRHLAEERPFGRVLLAL